MSFLLFYLDRPNVLLLPPAWFHREVKNLKTEFFPNQVVREVLLSVWVTLSIRPQSPVSSLFSWAPHLILDQYAYFISVRLDGLQFLKHLDLSFPHNPVSSGHEHQLTWTLSSEVNVRTTRPFLLNVTNVSHFPLLLKPQEWGEGELLPVVITTPYFIAGFLDLSNSNILNQILLCYWYLFYTF